MEETEKPRTIKGVKQPGKLGKVRAHLWDIIIGLALVLVIGYLGVTLINKLIDKHDVSQARTVSTAAIVAVHNQDGAAARKLGDKSFQATYSASALTATFKKIAPVASGVPTVDTQTLYKGNPRVVYTIYAYSSANVTYYLRTAVTHENGRWQLSSLTGNSDESKLLVVK
jgi:hypothetical protein